eukprot:10676868-Alexandrium_andersonii.AAC.1
MTNCVCRPTFRLHRSSTRSCLSSLVDPRPRASLVQLLRWVPASAAATLRAGVVLGVLGARVRTSCSFVQLELAECPKIRRSTSGFVGTANCRLVH